MSGPPLTEPVPPRRLAGIAAALVALTLALYWPGRSHDFTNYDDTLYVTENPAVQRGLDSVGWAFHPDSIVAANWHPVTMVSHLLDVEWFGDDATGHHFTSFLLHALNTALVFLVLARLGASPLAAGLVAAWFAFHPVQVQSVAWIAERKNVLSTTFWLLSIWVYAGATPPSPRRLAGVTVLGLLGLLAKPMVVTLPFTLLLLDAGPLRRRAEGWRRLWLEKAPLLALTAGFSWLTLRVQSEGHAVQSFPLGTRLANAVASVGLYLRDLAWPGPRSIFLPYPDAGPATGEIALGATTLLAGTVVAFLLRRRAVGVATGWLWFLGTLVPVLGLVQVGDQARADRYLYVPALGIFAAVVAIGALGRGANVRRGLIAVGVLAALGFGWRTRVELAPWADSTSLFRHALEQNEANYLAQNNLATALLPQGEIPEAIRRYERSVALNPDWSVSRMNLGIAYLQARRAEDAERSLRFALRLRPGWAEAHSNLGAALMLQRRWDEAIVELETALRADPSLVQARNNLNQARQYRARENSP